MSYKIILWIIHIKSHNWYSIVIFLILRPRRLREKIFDQYPTRSWARQKLFFFLKFSNKNSEFNLVKRHVSISWSHFLFENYRKKNNFCNAPIFIFLSPTHPYTKVILLMNEWYFKSYRAHASLMNTNESSMEVRSRKNRTTTSLSFLL